MDPIGLALENFDAVGAWRAKQGDADIDVSATLPDGAKINGPAELRAMLTTQHAEEYLDTVTRKLFVYALGRDVESYDEPVLRAITREAAPKGNRLQSLILAVIKSAPFQMRRSAAS
jgi:hypothetical protein